MSTCDLSFRYGGDETRDGSIQIWWGGEGCYNRALVMFQILSYDSKALVCSHA